MRRLFEFRKFRKELLYGAWFRQLQKNSFSRIAFASRKAFQHATHAFHRTPGYHDYEIPTKKEAFFSDLQWDIAGTHFGQMTCPSRSSCNSVSAGMDELRLFLARLSPFK